MLRILGLAAMLAQAPAPQPNAGEKAADPGSKMICKKFLETGSLVRGHRECKTKADWERERDALRQSQGSTTGCSSMGQTGHC